MKYVTKYSRHLASSDTQLTTSTHVTCTRYTIETVPHANGEISWLMLYTSNHQAIAQACSSPAQAIYIEDRFKRLEWHLTLSLRMEPRAQL